MTDKILAFFLGMFLCWFLLALADLIVSILSKDKEGEK